MTFYRDDMDMSDIVAYHIALTSFHKTLQSRRNYHSHKASMRRRGFVACWFRRPTAQLRICGVGKKIMRR